MEFYHNVAPELIDGAVYGIGFMDDGDQARHDSRLRAANYAMDHTLRLLQDKSPGAHWREPPKVERIGDKVQITARLELAGHG